MSELSWKEAIIKVLSETREPLHYTDIAQTIATQRIKSKFGATPAASVTSTISVSLQNEGDKSPFLKVSRGYYTLKNGNAAPVTIEERDETGFLNAFGMYWRRDNILWKRNPKLLGQQQLGSKPVNFCQQKGVYLLYDGSKVVYVGRASEQSLGSRLHQHISDRLNGRWDRFSWFGIFSVGEDGSLSESQPTVFNLENLIATMEALLIEGLEPPQNRKRGDDFSAVEFLQVSDPDIQKNQFNNLLDELKKKL